MTGEKTFKNPFASGLGRSGRMAAWVVAIGAVAAYNYYESSKVGEFTKDEQEAWNKQKKEASASKRMNWLDSLWVGGARLEYMYGPFLSIETSTISWSE